MEKETAVLAIPKTCTDKIITLYHKSLFAGHQGVIKTYLTISDKFFIPNLIHYLRSYIKGCHLCQLSCNEKLPSRHLQTRNYSPYELTFGRKPKVLLNLESSPDIKVSKTFKEYYELLNKRIKYLQDVLFNFKSQRLAMINKNRENFQYRGGYLVYIISPLTSQLRTASWKIAIKYVGPVVVYKIIDPHNYLLMTLDGKILRGIFEHERLKTHCY